jgi:hypothetical protein
MATVDTALAAPTQLAIVKLFGKDAADLVRDRVGQGEYPIDATVRIVGTLKVHADYMQKNHQRLNPLLLIALLLDGMPKQVRNARIRDAVARAAAGEAPDISEIKEATEEAVATLMASTEALARGKTVFHGELVLAEAEVTA